ncbi:hypothetical protein OG243_07515 [Streptomyces sp. NBC_01318]|nr:MULTISPECIES: hypothetical protein [unclassified Streptomyces]WSC40802.1 hypothetical protein OHA08_37815 [Streptomyces sp. NBC_01763]WSJ49408.1 hypothetical protein OG243_07515 [Streptomyces sp. NBC_01318]
MAFHAAVRFANRLGQVGQLVEESVDVLAAHPGGGTGEPVGQVPLTVALAAAPAAVRHGDPAADLGEGLFASCTRWKWSTTRAASGRTRRIADLKIVHMSIATYRTASRQAWSRSASR